MQIETFELERRQSLWENRVKYNLTESGVHPYRLDELLGTDELNELVTMRLGYGQTNGSEGLRAAICGLYKGLDIDNVLVTNGSSEANFVAMHTLLEEGDELVYMLPNYQQIWGVARAAGVKVKPFHLREDLQWGPDLEELEKAVGPDTKVIAVCNPNNPTGAVFSEETMDRIVELARAHDAWIYADEVYRGAEMDGEETPSFIGRYEKTVVAGGLSKAYALPGLRIGWLAGPGDVIEACWSHRDYTSICSSLISQYVAERALQPEMRKEILQRNRSMLRGNLKAFSGWVDSHADLFSFIPPKAGGMAFLSYRMDMNSTELATRLREEQSVFLVAGDCFGMDRYLRIGIGAEKEYLLTGLGLVDEWLDDL